MAATFFPSGYDITEPFILTDTNETAVYTVPGDKYACITQIWASDDGADARALTVEAAIGGVDYTLAYQKVIAANAQIDLKFERLLLKAGEHIDCTASAAGIHVLVIGIEYPKDAGGV